MTRDEKERLDVFKTDLTRLSQSIVNQANAVTDRVTRIRLYALAGEATRLAAGVGDLIE